MEVPKILSKERFNSLSLGDKYTWITENGKYIGIRFSYNYSIILYMVGDSFFELWYFRSESSIEKIEPLDDIKKIDLYIKQMQEMKKVLKPKDDLIIID